MIDVPEATRSAMAHTTERLFESEVYVADQGSATSRMNAISAPLQQLVDKDPAASKALGDATAAISALPRLEDPGLDVVLANRGGVNLLAFDSNGLVTQTGRLELFSDHFDGAPALGGHINRVRVTDTRHPCTSGPGRADQMVNVDAYIEIRTNYSSVFIQAAATAGLSALVNFFVLDSE